MEYYGERLETFTNCWIEKRPIKKISPVPFQSGNRYYTETLQLN